MVKTIQNIYKSTLTVKGRSGMKGKMHIVFTDQSGTYMTESEVDKMKLEPGMEMLQIKSGISKEVKDKLKKEWRKQKGENSGPGIPMVEEK